jgi:hypothetical protein
MTPHSRARGWRLHCPGLEAHLRGESWPSGKSLFEAAARLFRLPAALIGFPLLPTALLGWCPMRRFMGRLGIKEREEILTEICRRS